MLQSEIAATVMYGVKSVLTVVPCISHATAPQLVLAVADLQAAKLNGAGAPYSRYRAAAGGSRLTMGLGVGGGSIFVAWSHGVPV